MNKPETNIRHEAMRIGGEKVTTDKVIEVRYPYTNEVIGTVPAGDASHAKRAAAEAVKSRKTWPNPTPVERWLQDMEIAGMLN